MQKPKKPPKEWENVLKGMQIIMKACEYKGANDDAIS